MGKGIEIPFVADVTKFIGGTRDVQSALGKVSDALDDVARDAQASTGSISDDAQDAARDLRTYFEAAAEQVERDLKDAARSGEMSAEQLQRAHDEAAQQLAQAYQEALTEAGRDVQTATQKMEKSFAELAQAAKTSAASTGEALEKETKHGAGKATENVEEFKTEALQNFSEVTSSFTGSMDSAADVIQGTLGGLASGISGPLGLALGGAAIGVGALYTKLQEAADKANQLTENAAELATTMRSTDLAEQVSTLRDRWQEVATSIGDARSVWEFWQPRAVTTIEQMATAARTAGVDIAGLYQAFTETDPTIRLTNLRESLTAVQAAGASVRREAEQQDGATRRADETYRQYIGRLANTIDALDGTQTALRDQIAQQEAATQITAALAAAEGKTVEQYEASQQAIAATEAVQKSYAAALDATADPVATYQQLLQAKQDAEREAAEATAAATESSTDSWEDYATDVTISTQELIDEWNRQADQATAFQTNLAIISAAGGQALADELRAKGPEVAGAVAEVIATAGPEQQQAAIDAYARASGEATGQALVDGLNTKKTAWTTALAQFATLAGNVRVGVSSQAMLDAAGLSGRAGGGTVNTGTPYIVGETEPELFVPGQTGTILNNDQLTAALARRTVTIPPPPTRAQASTPSNATRTYNLTVNNQGELTGQDLVRAARAAEALDPAW